MVGSEESSPGMTWRFRTSVRGCWSRNMWPCLAEILHFPPAREAPLVQDDGRVRAAPFLFGKRRISTRESRMDTGGSLEAKAGFSGADLPGLPDAVVPGS